MRMKEHLLLYMLLACKPDGAVIQEPRQPARRRQLRRRAARQISLDSDSSEPESPAESAAEEGEEGESPPPGVSRRQRTQRGSRAAAKQPAAQAAAVQSRKAEPKPSTEVYIAKLLTTLVYQELQGLGWAGLCCAVRCVCSMISHKPRSLQPLPNDACRLNKILIASVWLQHLRLEGWGQAEPPQVSHTVSLTQQAQEDLLLGLGPLGAFGVGLLGGPSHVHPSPTQPMTGVLTFPQLEASALRSQQLEPSSLAWGTAGFQGTRTLSNPSCTGQAQASGRTLHGSLTG